MQEVVVVVVVGLRQCVCMCVCLLESHWQMIVLNVRPCDWFRQLDLSVLTLSEMQQQPLNLETVDGARNQGMLQVELYIRIEL